MRRALALMLVMAALAGLMPLLPKAAAYLRATVQNAAFYTIASRDPILSCSVPSNIVMPPSTVATMDFFSCANNAGEDVTVFWDVWDDGGGGFLTASGSAALADGTSGCRTVTLTSSETTGKRSVIFRAVTASDSLFYVELYFTGNVQVKAPKKNRTVEPGGGCP